MFENRKSVYGSYIVDGEEQNNIYPYVVAYRNVLEGIGVNVLDAKLFSNYYELLDIIGCEYGACSPEYGGSAPEWFYKPSYWVGNIGGTDGFVTGIEKITFSEGFNNSTIAGIRPLITIQTSDLG